MCGISGLAFNGIGEDLSYKRRLINQLLVNLQDRGKDASGIALINTKENNIIVFKMPIKAKELVKEEGFNTFLDRNLGNSNLVLLHARATTQGNASDNQNNHPILNKNNNTVLIHNGMINNYKTLKDELKLSCDAEVDSEIILKLYEHHKGNMDKVTTDLSGSYTFALYDKGNLFCFRDNNPLNFGYIKKKGVLVFASTDDIMKEATKSENLFLNMFPLDGDLSHVVEIKRDNLVTINFKDDFSYNVEMKELKNEDGDYKDDVKVYIGGYSGYSSYSGWKGNNDRWVSKKHKGTIDDYTQNERLMVIKKTLSGEHLTKRERKILRHLEYSGDLEEAEDDYRTERELWNDRVSTRYMWG